VGPLRERVGVQFAFDSMQAGAPNLSGWRRNRIWELPPGRGWL